MNNTIMDAINQEFYVFPENKEELDTKLLLLDEIMEELKEYRKIYADEVIAQQGTDHYSVVRESIRTYTNWLGIINELKIKIPPKVYEAFTKEQVVKASIRRKK